MTTDYLHGRNLGVEGVAVWRGGSDLYVLGGGNGGGAASRTACMAVAGLSPGQLKFCHLYPDHMPSVSRGAQLAIKECQWQFRGRRWNCSTVADSSVFGPAVDVGLFL